MITILKIQRQYCDVVLSRRVNACPWFSNAAFRMLKHWLTVIVVKHILYDFWLFCRFDQWIIVKRLNGSEHTRIWHYKYFSVCFVFINDSASYRGSQSFCFVTVLIPGNMYARIFQGLIARSNVCELKWDQNINHACQVIIKTRWCPKYGGKTFIFIQEKANYRLH